MCPILFNPAPSHSNQKYCSKLCRMKAFHLKNPNIRRGYNQKWRAKQPRLCVRCAQTIPIERRKPGRVFCSENCLRLARLESGARFRNKVHDAFRRHKEKIGCKICRYRKYGGSLAYHHRDPQQKRSRIMAKDFYYKTIIWKTERPKCSLICANCHGEMHYYMRHDKKRYDLMLRKLLK